MKLKMFALLAASTLAFTVACGDSETSTDATGGNGGNGTGGEGTGGDMVDMCVDDTAGEPRAMSGDCQAACEILFCCAEQECDGLEPGDKEAYVTGCVPTCEMQAALIAVVNGENCETTVSTVRGADTSGAFGETCDNGISGGGGAGGAAGGAGGAAGGAGGSGASGGAGGN